MPVSAQGRVAARVSCRGGQLSRRSAVAKVEPSRRSAVTKVSRHEGQPSRRSAVTKVSRHEGQPSRRSAVTKVSRHEGQPSRRSAVTKVSRHEGQPSRRSAVTKVSRHEGQPSRRSAVVGVEAAAGLAAQVARGDHPGQRSPAGRTSRRRSPRRCSASAWRRMSTPVRSVVASGPIGWPKPEPAGGVDVLGAGDTALDEPDRLHRQRADQPGRDEAGDVAVDHDAGLADRLGERRGRWPASRRWSCRPRISSQSPIIGTGEKKWVPTTDSGRAVTAAIEVIGMALVLLASTAPSRQIRSSSRKTSCLTSSCSKTASTTMSASAAASRSVVVVIRPSAASASPRGQAFLGHEPVERPPDAVQAALEGVVRDVAQHHLVPGGSRRPGRCRRPSVRPRRRRAWLPCARAPQC